VEKVTDYLAQVRGLRKLGEEEIQGRRQERKERKKKDREEDTVEGNDPKKLKVQD
jgi:hypothetical protein